MPSYLTLWNWTDAGIKDFRRTTERVEQVKADFQKQGLTIDVRWLAGAYDGMAMIEAPDDESATAALLRLGSAGNIRTTTMRAFKSDEMARILEKAGS
jgi:uncharacterized protein with GYD domain